MQTKLMVWSYYFRMDFYHQITPMYIVLQSHLSSFEFMQLTTRILTVHFFESTILIVQAWATFRQPRAALYNFQVVAHPYDK